MSKIITSVIAAKLLRDTAKVEIRRNSVICWLIAGDAVEFYGWETDGLIRAIYYTAEEAAMHLIQNKSPE